MVNGCCKSQSEAAQHAPEEVFMWFRLRGRVTSSLAAFVCYIPTIAGAQSVESFYRGKTLSMIIGYPTGNSNDMFSRSVARHIGKHIPGNPSVIPRNMPGGGSLIAANHVFNVAPKDGTVLALVAASTPLEERLGAPNVRFRAERFNWIGRMASGVSVAF